MYDHRHYYSPHRLHIKTIRQLVCTSRKQACVHILWEKEKAYKNVKGKNTLTQPALHRIVLRYPTPSSFFIYSICFTHRGEIIHCFDGWCLYALIYRHKAEEHPSETLYFYPARIGCRNRLFHSVLVCFDFLQFQQHYFLTVIAVYTVDREASWRLNRFLVRSPTGSQK